MVNLIPNRKSKRAAAGWLVVELVAALAVLTAALVPLAFSWARDQRALRLLLQGGRS